MRRLLPLLIALCCLPVADASAARIWFTAGEQFRVVKRHAPTPRAALTALLRGPKKAERRHGIHTQIARGLAPGKLKLSGHTATVTLAKRFGRAKKPEVVEARLGQLVFTLTQFKRVHTVNVKGVQNGLRRSDFAKPAHMPPIFGGALGQPVPGTTELQTRLAKLGYLPASAIDGLYGYQTTQAVIAFQAVEGLTRDGVAGPQTKARLKIAKRPKPFATGPSKRIEVDRALGVAFLIKKGKVSRVVHVSTGAGVNATPTGRYRVFRKELRSWSVPFHTWLPYASYFNNGIAFHEYPDVPAYPASHGCVRVPAPEAPGVYKFATLGTRVIVR